MSLVLDVGATATNFDIAACAVPCDQVAAQEGRLLFMTTNHIERLNDALIRPGRVDVRCFLGPATRQQARNLFVSFYRDLPHLLLRLPQDLAAAAVMAEDDVPLLAGSSQGAAGGQSAAAAKTPSPDAAASDDSKAVSPQAAAAEQALLQQQPGHKQPQAVRSASLSTSRAEAAAAAQELAQREAVLVDLAQQFAAQLPAEGGVSMAQLQGFLMTHRCAT